MPRKLHAYPPDREGRNRAIRAGARRAVGGWLLVKMDDEAADARGDPVKTEPRSVLSGKTMEKLAGGSPHAESRAA
jgi:hypothetical protein